MFYIVWIKNSGEGVLKRQFVVNMRAPSLKWNDNDKKVQVGNAQEKAQSEKDSHSKNRGGKKLY